MIPESPEPETPLRRFRLLRNKGQLAVAGLVVLALIGGSVAYGLGAFEAPPAQTVAGSDDDEAITAPEEEEEDSGPSTVFSDPEKFLDQELNLTVVVEEVVDPASFRVIGEDLDADSLLVVHDGIPKVPVDSLVDLTGRVTVFDPAAVNRYLGHVVPGGTFALSDDEYVLVATEVAVVEFGQPVAQGQDEQVAPDDSVVTSVASAPVVAAPPTTTTTTSTGTSSGSTSGTSGGSSGSSGSSGGGTTASSGGSSGGSTTTVEFTSDGPTSAQHSDETEFEARLTTRDGEPIEDAKMIFKLRGPETRRFKAKTDHKGVASVTPVMSQRPGDYRLIAIYDPPGDPAPSKDRTRFVIEKDETLLELDSESDHNSDDEGEEEEGEEHGNRNKTDSLTAILADPDDSAGLEGRTVSFYADGELIGTATTDANGFATIEVPEEYRKSKNGFEARFEGDDYYLGSADTA